jgi:hypothetical protein
MNGRSDEQTVGQTDSWMNRQLDEQTVGRTDSWTNRQLDKHSWTNRQMDEQTVGRTNSWMNRQLDEQTVRQIDSQMNGWMNADETQWKGINRKRSPRWQHLSRLKASAFFSLQKKFSCYETQQLILGIGNAIL